MRTSVVDFLNHGLLPFVGREKEVERILEFARGRNDISGLRAMLLSGEAGSGKSRLVEEVLAQMESEGNLIIHTKLRPDSAVAPAPLLAVALWSSSSASPLLREEPAPNLPSIIGAIRRLCRLRKTVVVVEDAHLLEGAGIREFSLFVEALAEEPLTLLVAARPAELKGRGAFEAYLVEEVHLPPLDEENVHLLWDLLFGSASNAEVLQILQETTLGNPLAFRSALRGAINANILVNDGDMWNVTVDLQAFREMAERSARRLTEGMASHLTEEERGAALRLARLGEIFAPEAARLLIEDADRMISLLLFKGILVRSNAVAASLRDPGVRGLPFAFAHSLLHRTLLEAEEPLFLPLLGVIASDVPLYSVTPFLVLEENRRGEDVSAELLFQVVEKAVIIVNRMDRSADWLLAPKIWEVIERIGTEILKEQGSEEGLERLQLYVLATRLTHLGRADESEEYFQLSSQLLEKTRGGLETGNSELLALHIRGYLNLFRYSSRRDRARCSKIIESVENLVERFPSLRMSLEYRAFLRTIGSCAYIFGFYLKDLQYVENACHLAAEQSGGDKAVYKEWLHDFGYYLLSSFTTADELQRKQALFSELRQSRLVRPHYYIREIAFLLETGWNAEALELITKYRPILRDIGLLRTVASCFIYEAEALVALDTPLETIRAKVNEAIADPTVEPAIQDRRREHVGRNLAAWFVVNGRGEQMGQLQDTFALSTEHIPLTARIILSLPTLEELRGVELVRPIAGPESVDIDDPDADLDVLIPIVRGLMEGGAIADAALEDLQSFLQQPVLRRYRLLSFQAALVLVDELERRKLLVLDESWGQVLGNAVDRVLLWFVERNISRGGSWFFEISGKFLPADKKKEWGRRFGGEESGGGAEERGDEFVEVTMLGTITFRHPGGEIERLRGARNHLMLGLLIADAILKVPLTRNVFLTLASGVEDDPERARRTMNMAVLRLREAIGSDVVLTEGDTPRLNSEKVRVDLIEARQLLNEAESMIRKGRLTQGVDLLRDVFEISGGDVPFPGLYDELFENLRREFEDDLLHAILMLGRMLLREGDYENALDVLTQGTEIFSDHDELEELQAAALNGARGFTVKSDSVDLTLSP